MFTGIIEEVGRIEELKVSESGARIVVACRKVWNSLDVGESVCVNGVCLTAVEIKEGLFVADISRETLERSTLAKMKRGSAVNLERALALGSRLGGHMVQGHVDGVGRVKTVRREGDGRIYIFKAPPEVEAYLVKKGSIAVDGISLTISELGRGDFAVAVIPHTLEETDLRELKAGDSVNLEVDIIAKYMRKYMEHGRPGREETEKDGDAFYDKLAEGGFL